MPILTGIQRRNYEVGRIRAGDKDSEGRPHRLDGFRFTTPSAKVAGEVAEFTDGDAPRRWGQQWEVYTKVREIAVALPPGDLVISQAMMRWSGGGPVMVCDGMTTSQPVKGPCQCPQPADSGDEQSLWDAINERRRLAGLKVPRGCYPYTWVNVCLVDIGGFGVWKLLSKSENAAAEILQQAILLEKARSIGQYLPARLALEYREARVGGVLRQYNVPAIRVDPSIRAIATGDFSGRSLAEQLPPAPGEAPRAITSGAAAQIPAPRQPAPAEPAAGEDHETTQAAWEDAEEAKLRRAQEIARELSGPVTAEVFRACVAEAKNEGLMGEYVCTDRDANQWEELGPYLEDRWAELAGAEKGRAS